MNRVRFPLAVLGVAVAFAAMTGKLSLHPAETKPAAAKLPSPETPSDEARARQDAASVVVAPTIPDRGAGERATALDQDADAPNTEPDDAQKLGAGGEEASTVSDPTVTAGLAYLDQIRAIPGAAPLLDDILEFMKQDNGATFSLGNLPRNANGLAKIDADTNKKMIGNPEILKKWETLMALIAENNAKGAKDIKR